MIRPETKSTTIRQALKQTGVKTGRRKVWELYRAAWLETPFWATFPFALVIFLTVAAIDSAADLGLFARLWTWLAG